MNVDSYATFFCCLCHGLLVTISCGGTKSGVPGGRNCFPESKETVEFGRPDGQEEGEGGSSLAIHRVYI